MKKYITGLLICAASSAFAQQEADQLANKGLYNKIEYFINSQQTDSIYLLGSSRTQVALPKDQFSAFLSQHVYPLGKIKNAALVSFENGNASYDITFEHGLRRLLFSVDSTLHYQTLNFLPQEAAAKVVHTSPVERVSSGESPQDFMVDSLASIYLRNSHTQTLSIGIINKGSMQKYFFGETAKGNRTAATGTTIYEVASVTKVFTAVLLADLVGKNLISLDDAIIKYLPDSVASNPDLKHITFKQLANHSSGLPSLPDNLSQAATYNPADPFKTYGRKELYAALKKQQIRAEDINQYAFSDYGFALLGDLIQTITKKSFEQLLREQITGPLGMPNTVVQVNPKLQTRLAGHNLEGTALPAANWQSFAPANGLNASLDDLLTFAKAQFKMPETSLEQAMALTKQFTFFLPPDTDLGLAWQITMHDDLISYQQRGESAGNNCYLILTPDHKSALVILSNSSESVASLGDALINYILR